MAFLGRLQRFDLQPEGLAGSCLATKGPAQPTEKGWSGFCYSCCPANGSAAVKGIYFLQCSVLTDPPGFHAVLPPEDIQACQLHELPHHLYLRVPEPGSADRRGARPPEVVPWSPVSFCIQHRHRQGTGAPLLQVEKGSEIPALRSKIQL